MHVLLLDSADVHLIDFDRTKRQFRFHPNISLGTKSPHTIYSFGEYQIWHNSRYRVVRSLQHKTCVEFPVDLSQVGTYTALARHYFIYTTYTGYGTYDHQTIRVRSIRRSLNGQTEIELTPLHSVTIDQTKIIGWSSFHYVLGRLITSNGIFKRNIP